MIPASSDLLPPVFYSRCAGPVTNKTTISRRGLVKPSGAPRVEQKCTKEHQTMKLFLLLILLQVGATSVIKAQSLPPDLANQLQSKIENLRIANNLKGISACVMYPGMGTWQGVSGISHPGAPITSDMAFGIASNTKLFTGVLLLKLAEKKIVNLNDSLHRYLPVFKNIDPNITIRQLLNHTSGLADVTSVTGYPDSILTNPNRIFTPAELMTWAGPPLFPAGTSWNYCNTNYLLAGMIAESATGKRYGQLLRDSILSPLHLDSTFLDVYDSLACTIAHPWQAGVDNISIPRKSLNSAAGAAGAMYSTSGEMAQWYHALMNGKFLSAQSFTELTTFVGAGNYGIGISKATVFGRTVWQHGGTIWGGYNSFMLYDPASGAIICVLINQLPAQAIQVAVQLFSVLVNNAVGVREEDEEGEGIAVYPNPTSGLVNVKVPDRKPASIKIYNLSGQLMKETTEPQFFISNFPSAVYFVQVQTGAGTYLRTLVKKR
jgi:D-alanyl-D-alanine carboxypeptidase